MTFLTLMKRTVVGYSLTNGWSDTAIKMPLTATDHPRFGDIHTQIENQVWKLKIRLSDFPNNRKTSPLPEVYFFLVCLGGVRIQVMLWHSLEKNNL